ncbi:thioesterase family protein [Sporolactobacillus spathodeae]|uniref:Acyl-CoA thioester hydrolase n=1 Tax=Sporolactobacillus spathodeae TaxID=1465502 RepID=A0ABS2Q825_9BACL|nr:acyl-CoA thioester hydrolase [Sporolactobacillus spathodeae]
MFTVKIPVRFVDCDGMGHVNNAVYHTYFEEGKREIFRLFTPDLSLDDFHVIVASTHCDYIHEISYGETVTVYTWVSTISRSSFDIDHAIADENGNWHARGRVTMIGYDYRRKEVVPLSDSIKAILDQHHQGPNGVPALRQLRSEGLSVSYS